MSVLHLALDSTEFFVLVFCLKGSRTAAFSHLAYYHLPFQPVSQPESVAMCSVIERQRAGSYLIIVILQCLKTQTNTDSCLKRKQTRQTNVSTEMSQSMTQSLNKQTAIKNKSYNQMNRIKLVLSVSGLMRFTAANDHQMNVQREPPHVQRLQCEHIKISFLLFHFDLLMHARRNKSNVNSL